MFLFNENYVYMRIGSMPSTTNPSTCKLAFSSFDRMPRSGLFLILVTVGRGLILWHPLLISVTHFLLMQKRSVVWWTLFFFLSKNKPFTDKWRSPMRTIFCARHPEQQAGRPLVFFERYQTCGSSTFGWFLISWWINRVDACNVIGDVIFRCGGISLGVFCFNSSNTEESMLTWGNIGSSSPRQKMFCRHHTTCQQVVFRDVFWCFLQRHCSSFAIVTSSLEDVVRMTILILSFKIAIDSTDTFPIFCSALPRI